MTIPPELLEAYQRTVVALHLVDGRVLTITPRPLPPEGDGRPVEIGDGPFVLTHARRIDVLTAANPQGRPRPDTVNRAANGRLRMMLRQRGVDPGDLLVAEGRAPRGYERWHEPSLALLDVPAPLVVVHARIFEQLGWYRWDRRGWRLLLTTEPGREIAIPAVGRLSGPPDRATR